MSFSKNDSKLKEKIYRYSSEQDMANLAHSRSGIQPFKTTEKYHSFAFFIVFIRKSISVSGCGLSWKKKIKKTVCVVSKTFS